MHLSVCVFNVKRFTFTVDKHVVSLRKKNNPDSSTVFPWLLRETLTLSHKFKLTNVFMWERAVQCKLCFNYS